FLVTPAPVVCPPHPPDGPVRVAAQRMLLDEAPVVGQRGIVAAFALVVEGQRGQRLFGPGRAGEARHHGLVRGRLLLLLGLALRELIGGFRGHRRRRFYGGERGLGVL